MQQKCDTVLTSASAYENLLIDYFSFNHCETLKKKKKPQNSYISWWISSNKEMVSLPALT